MTQQALRELVELAEKHIRIANSDAPYSEYEANKEILVGTLVDAIPHLKALLGKQREAQGDVAPENKEYVGLVCPVCLIQLHPSAVLSDVVEHYYGNGTCPLYGKEFDARLMRGWQPKVPPLAESVGDVPKHMEKAMSSDIHPKTPTEIAAQIWCKPEHSQEIINVKLASSFAEELEKEQKHTDSWFNTAAQFSRDANFYRGIIRQIGEMLGEEAYTSDDGSVQRDVLALKVPELVRRHMQQGE